jgi:hypothetical protein
VLLDVVDVGVVDLLTEVILGLGGIDLAESLIMKNSEEVDLKILRTNSLELLPAGKGGGNGREGSEGNNAVHFGSKWNQIKQSPIRTKIESWLIFRNNTKF